MFQTLTAQLGLGAMLIVCGAAILRGRWPERLVGAALCFAWVLSGVLQDLATGHTYQPAIFRHRRGIRRLASNLAHYNRPTLGRVGVRVQLTCCAYPPGRMDIASGPPVRFLYGLLYLELLRASRACGWRSPRRTPGCRRSARSLIRRHQLGIAPSNSQPGPLPNTRSTSIILWAGRRDHPHSTKRSCIGDIPTALARRSQLQPRRQRSARIRPPMAWSMEHVWVSRRRWPSAYIAQP